MHDFNEAHIGFGRVETDNTLSLTLEKGAL